MWLLISKSPSSRPTTGFGVGVLLARVVGGAGTDHRAPLDGGRRPGPAAFIGVQQVEDELPSRRLACQRRAGDPGVALARTVPPAGRKPGIRTRSTPV